MTTKELEESERFYLISFSLFAGFFKSGNEKNQYQISNFEAKKDSHVFALFLWDSFLKNKTVFTAASVAETKMQICSHLSSKTLKK